MPGCLSLVRKGVKEAVPTSQLGLVASLFRLMDALMQGAGLRQSAHQAARGEAGGMQMRASSPTRMRLQGPGKGRGARTRCTAVSG